MDEQIKREGQPVEPKPKPLPKQEPNKPMIPPGKPVKPGQEILTD